MHKKGLRLVQHCVLDTRNTDVVNLIKQQCLPMNGTQSEKEALEFTEAALAEVEGWWV